MSEQLRTHLPHVLKEHWKNPKVQQVVGEVLQPSGTGETKEQIRRLRQRRTRDLEALLMLRAEQRPDLVNVFRSIDETLTPPDMKKATKREVAYAVAVDDDDVRATYSSYRDLENYVRSGTYEVETPPTYQS